MKEHPPVTNCGFGYFLSIYVVAAVGFILFVIVAKNYKFRKRGERSYDHRFAEKYFDQVIAHREQESDSGGSK